MEIIPIADQSTNQTQTLIFEDDYHTTFSFRPTLSPKPATIQTAEQGATPKLSDILRERRVIRSLEYQKPVEDGDDQYYRDIQREDEELKRDLPEDERLKSYTIRKIGLRGRLTISRRRSSTTHASLKTSRITK
jgi:hypothetical protein